MLWLNKIWLTLQNNFFAEQSRWIASVPFLFALGIALYFALPTEPNLWIVLGLFEGWLLLFYLLRRKKMHLFFMGGLIIFAGFINIEMHTLYQSRKIENFSEQRITYLQGRISDISYNSKGKVRLLLDDVSDYDKPLNGHFRITLNEQANKWRINQVVEMIATIFPREPMPLLNGYQSDRKYFYESLSGIGYADSEVFEVRYLPQEARSTLSSRLNGFRQKITAYVLRLFPIDQAGVISALLVGEKSQIPQQIADNYRNSGLAHFLSVSGLHLGAISGLVFFVIRFLLALFPIVSLRYDIKKIAAICAIFFSALYLLISGMAIPAQRAFIMTAVVFIGVIFNRQAISLRMVSFAAMVILVISPQALVSISFQMSFAAVYALISLYETCVPKIISLRQHSGMMHMIFYYLLGIVVCDFVASLATAPFAVYHFHRLALYTSLGNLLAGPLIAFWLMPAILLCLATIPFGAALYPLKILGAGVSLLNKITAFVASLPHSVWTGGTLSLGALLAIVCGGYWFCIWQKSWRYWGLFPIAVGILSLFLPQKAPDMVFSAHAAQIAIRTTDGTMLLLPRRKDMWLQQIWQENLVVKQPDKTLEKVLRMALQGKEKMPEYIPLVCDEEKCVYKQRIIIRDNAIILDGEETNTSVGGYVYIGEKIYMKPFYTKKKRLWKNNFYNE